MKYNKSIQKNCQVEKPVDLLSTSLVGVRAATKLFFL